MIKTLQRFLILFIFFFLLLIFPKLVNGNNAVYQIASHLRGEAPAGCEECRVITVCSLVRDYNSGIYLPSRWYGFQKPGQADLDLTKEALETNLCDSRPICKFTGNARDLGIWARKGWVTEEHKIESHCNENGCTVCVEKIERKYQEE